MEKSNPQQCVNCNHPVEHHFCPNCGQTRVVQKIDNKFIWHDVQHGVFHFDSAFLFTLLQLYKNPGKVIKNFIQGKRKPYANPFTLLLFLSTVYTLLSFHYGNAESKWKFYDDNGKLETTVTYLINHQTWFILFILPIISFITFLLFKKSQYNYYEILVYECFIQTKILVLNFLFLPLNYLYKADFLPVLSFVIVGFFTIRAKVLFFDSYSFGQVFFRSLLALVLNWIGILFFLIVLAVGIQGFRMILH